ncbi:zinc finger protein 107-like [Schistocerca piceifrons]|uniref:zinc finger protein 107-like n=1 Tax=Schistocerca piceifrons TaxID=274613 RepID=UPI001F5F60CC|nr:zinc finger protein 107-like [Schistocerca piceifrons]
MNKTINIELLFPKKTNSSRSHPLHVEFRCEECYVQSTRDFLVENVAGPTHHLSTCERKKMPSLAHSKVTRMCNYICILKHNEKKLIIGLLLPKKLINHAVFPCTICHRSHTSLVNLLTKENVNPSALQSHQNVSPKSPECVILSVLLNHSEKKLKHRAVIYKKNLLFTQSYTILRCEECYVHSTSDFLQEYVAAPNTSLVNLRMKENAIISAIQRQQNDHPLYVDTFGVKNAMCKALAIFLHRAATSQKTNYARSHTLLMKNIYTSSCYFPNTNYTRSHPLYIDTLVKNIKTSCCYLPKNLLFMQSSTVRIYIRCEECYLHSTSDFLHYENNLNIELLLPKKLIIHAVIPWNNMNQILYTGSNTSNGTLLGKQDFKHKNLAATYTKQAHIWDTNNDLLLSTENYLGNTSLPLDSHFMVSIKCTESTLGCISNVRSNEQTQMGKRPYKCATCNKAFSLSLILHNHERVHTGERSHKGAACNKTFSDASNLRRHERIHTGEHPYACTTCNKAISQSSNLHRHERIHTGEHPYKCTTCNKAFSQVSYLHIHERIHTGERPYKGGICNKACSLASNLRSHERIHTGERPHKCATCNKALSVASYLRSHERIHVGERPYKCTTCNKAFSQTSVLLRHERIHTGERPYKCTTCNKAFSQASILHRHEQIHTGEHPYKCTTCSKAFSQASYLHSHERIHTGEWPYKYITCNKAFCQASVLHSHERVHTGELPFKCVSCNKAFSQASVLHSHERIHTGERPYKCTTCKKAFSSAAYRNRNLSYCWRRCMPSKGTTAIELIEEDLGKNNNSTSSTDLRHDTTKNSASKIGNNMNQVLYTGSITSSETLLGKQNFKHKNLAATCTKHDNIWDSKNDLLLSTENDLDNTSLPLDSHFMVSIKCTENTNGCISNVHSNEQTQMGERPYKCATCNKAFSLASILNNHERVHTRERSHKCTTCNKAFSYASNLRRHEPIHTGEHPYTCTTCNKAFSQSSNLHRHERIHTGEHLYKCTTCNKAFSQVSYLHIHERIHTGECPYKCTSCNKAFSKASYLHIHKRIHTGERPYKCATCNKAFSQASILHSHERIHTGERPYKCGICNKACSLASNLRSHERIHTGERPYKCNTCNKAFSPASYLRSHERIHTGERPYKCTICNKAFSRAANLHRHEQNHTGECSSKSTTCKKPFL